MKKEILFKLTKKDFVVTPFKAPGKGGQKKNKTMSACRIQHPDSGAMATATEHREFLRNRTIAFKRLTETKEFKLWHQKETWRHMGILDKIGKAVDKAMSSENLKVEVKDEKGRWVKE